MSQNSVTKVILLVEDEALLAMSTKMTLEKIGYSVIHVLNGEKALETVAEENIDLILMDIDLGKNRMDGTVAAEIILKDHDIPIIFHTSHAEKEMVEKVKGITRYGYVLKNAGEFVLIESIQMAFELFEAHQKAKEQEHQYELALYGGNLGTWDWNIQTDEVEFNTIWAEMKGYTLDEIEPHISSWEKRVHPVDFPMVNEKLDAHLRGETGTYEAEFRMKHKSGHWLWIIDRGKVIEWDRNGNPLRACGTHVDNTDRKKAEQELAKREENLRLTLNSIGDAVVTTDVKGNISNMNPVAEKLTGHAIEEVKNSPILDVMTLVDSRTGETVPNPIKTVLDTDKIAKLSNHTKLISKDGKEFYIADSGAPIQNENGDTTGVVLVFRDETKNYEQEKRLKEREEQFRRLFENSAQGIVYHAPDGTVVMANKASERILGLSYGELTGKTSMDPRWRAIHEDGSDFPGETHPAMLALRTGKKVERQIMGVFHPEKNEYVWISTSAFPEFRPGEDKPYRVFATFEDITESKKREIEHREHRRFLQTVFDSIQEPISVQDRDLNILEVNNKTREIFESGTPLTGKKCYEAFQQRSKHCDSCPVLRVFKTKDVQTEVITYSRNGDGERLLEVFAYPVFNNKDEVESVIEYKRDITERKRAEEKIKVYAARLELTLLAANMAWWEMDIKTGNVQFNEHKAVMLGYSPDQFHHYQDFMDLVHPDDYEATMDAMRKHLIGVTQRYETEYRIQTKSGDYKWFRDVGSVTERDNDGKPEKAAGIVIDITERKNAEELLQKALAESEELKRVVNNSPVCVFTWRNEKGWPAEYVSENVKNLVGYDAEDFISGGIAYTKLIHTDDLSRIEEEVTRNLTSGKWEYAQEYRLIDKDGTVHWVEDRSFVDTDAAGNPAIIHGLVWDVSQRKVAEEAVRRQLQEKELLIREIHHRIKNNIASIYGLLHLHAEQIENEEARSIVNEAVSRVNSMKDLYEKMLSSDDIRVVSAAPYINDLIDSIMQLFSHQADVTVYKRIADFTLDSDKLFLLGIIVNEVVTNAMKYAFAGRETGTIRVYCEKTEDRVSLIIQDDGIGLPEGFDAEQDGGLGMMLVTMLTRQLNGTVTFESEIGAKVTVEFTV